MGEREGKQRGWERGGKSGAAAEEEDQGRRRLDEERMWDLRASGSLATVRAGRWALALALALVPVLAEW